MFIENEKIRLKYEDYNDGRYVIKEAGVCDIYDIGGQPACNEPMISTYQQSEDIDYLYSMDYVILTDKFIMGYFIGAIGNNDCDTIFTTKDDLIYELLDIYLEYDYDEDDDPIEFNILFNYLLRHCKNNNCKLLQLRIDKDNRYNLFYNYVKNKFELIESNGFLIKRII